MNYSSVWATTDNTRLDSLTRSIKHTNSGHKYEFSLKVIQAQSEQQTKFQIKKKNAHSRLSGGMLPQLWDRFTWLTPGYVIQA